MAKRKSKSNLHVLIAVIVLMLLSVASFYISNFMNRPSFAHYDEFGIDLPANYRIHGIDVSRYQQSISWKDVKEMQVNGVRIGFAFIKATEGTGRMDAHFRRNWFHAEQAGMKKGAYHFFIASRSGKAQAINFMETVQLQKGDLPPVLDIEQANGVPVAQLQQRVSEWLKLVEEKYRVKPIIYTNVDFYKNFLSGKFDEYPLWVAHYLVKDKPRIDRDWSFWQHNETGQVDGIAAKVDFNVFNGDSAAFQKILVR